jgi:deoxyribodipyrimidine photo-lyase
MSTPLQKTIFWFRQDLRLCDNPGLYAALQKGPVMAIYILEDQSGDCKMGSTTCSWLKQSLLKLHQTLNHKLNFYQGNAKEIILKLIKHHDIDAVYWNRCYDPWRVQQDSSIKSTLKEGTIECKTFNASLLWEPWEIVKEDGSPYKVFSPFFQKGSLLQPPRQPIPTPTNFDLIHDPLQTEALTQWISSPINSKPGAHKLKWVIGEVEAQKRMNHFLEKGLQDYSTARDFPAQNHTSRLSPHLRFGKISPHQLWWAVGVVTLTQEEYIFSDYEEL